jgi:hypothetical protein
MVVVSVVTCGARFSPSEILTLVDRHITRSWPSGWNIQDCRAARAFKTSSNVVLSGAWSLFRCEPNALGRPK